MNCTRCYIDQARVAYIPPESRYLESYHKPHYVAFVLHESPDLKLGTTVRQVDHLHHEVVR